MSVRILVGDALAMLKTLESESVQICVTSPPYFQLRDYGVDGQIGLERTPLAFLEALWAVFDEVRRVLRPDGLCFVNIGDSYAGSGKGPTGHNGIGDQEQRQGFIGSRRGATSQMATRSVSGFQGGGVGVEGLPPKNLLLIPQRFAIGMQDRGWWVRSQIAWCKTSAMPESVRDRPTSAWEPIWMFSKSARYFYAADAVHRSSVDPPGVSRGGSLGRFGRDEQLVSANAHRGDQPYASNGGANLRNYWLLGPQPSSLNHYAGYPPELPKRCILAGSRRGDTVLDPFLGSGTTLLVASRFGRDGIGIELNPEYARMAEDRIHRDAGDLFPEDIAVETETRQPTLFEEAV